ncbi:hypothetical protein BGZ63DRAFT_112083 [Mariannaea sp. PMI_226]|nr:hypothetical protein BGZ63DRAFT_112083 [Mariannaea sp. PMI_226]
MSRHLRNRQLCAQLWPCPARAASSRTPALLLARAAAIPSQRPIVDGSCQSRTYAAPRAPRPAPRPSPRPAPKAVPRPVPSVSEKFNLNGITEEDFEAAVKATGVFNSMSAAEYYAVAKRFDDAIRNGTSPYNVRLDGVPVSALYDVGCIIFYVKGTTGQSATYASVMWLSASEMGSRPATISLARMIVRNDAWGKMAHFKGVEQRFRKLSAEGKDPNALTVQAELLYVLGNYNEAAKAAKRALEVGNNKFEWEPECRLFLAKSYIKLGKKVEAKEVLDSLEHLSLGEVHETLGQLLLSTDPEKAQQHIFMAGYNGRPGMYGLLSEAAIDGQASAKDAEERKEMNRWAMEWARLADKNAEF